MNFKPILIVPGEEKSIFFEIFFKSIRSKKFTSPLILICNSSPNNNLNNIEFITIASTGNATDFGDLFTGRYGSAS